MRIYKLVLLAVTASLATGCKKKENPFFYHIKGQFTISADSNVLNFHLVEIAFPTNADAAFKENGTREKRVKEITVDEVRMTIAGNTLKNFGFLQDLGLYIKQGGHSHSVLLGNKTLSASDTFDVLYLNVPPDNLERYFKKDEVSIHATGATRQHLEEEVTIQFDMRVKAKVGE